MFCPFCSAEDTRVIDSRLVANGAQVRRRRECAKCKERYTSFEVAELVMPKVIKRDDCREPFDEDKLRMGLQRALEKRPISTEQLEEAISFVILRVRETGEREVKSQLIGEVVMSALLKLDPVAYVRFASVYWDFKDIDAFKDLIEQLGRGCGDYVPYSPNSTAVE
jgi:transcriptional repressor NrdR